MTADGTYPVPRAGVTVSTADELHALPVAAVLRDALTGAVLVVMADDYDQPAGVNMVWGSSWGLSHGLTVLFRPDAPRPATGDEAGHPHTGRENCRTCGGDCRLTAPQRGGEALVDDPMPPEGIVREEVDLDDWSEAMVALLPGDYDGDPRDVIEAVMRRAAGGEAVDREALAEAAGDLLMTCATTTNHSMYRADVEKALDAVWQAGRDAALAARGAAAPTVSAEQVTEAARLLWEHQTGYRRDQAPASALDDRRRQVRRVLGVLGIEVRG